MKSEKKMKSATEWYEYLVAHPEKWLKVIGSSEVKGEKNVEENK